MPVDVPALQQTIQGRQSAPLLEVMGTTVADAIQAAMAAALAENR